MPKKKKKGCQIVKHAKLRGHNCKKPLKISTNLTFVKFDTENNIVLKNNFFMHMPNLTIAH